MESVNSQGKEPVMSGLSKRVHAILNCTQTTRWLLMQPVVYNRSLMNKYSDKLFVQFL